MWDFWRPRTQIPLDSENIIRANMRKHKQKNRLQNHIIQYIMTPALGHSLTVELRTLTPSVLVRIQLPQPKIKTPCVAFLFLVCGAMVQPRNQRLLVRQWVSENKQCAVWTLTNAPQDIYLYMSEGISCHTSLHRPVWRFYFWTWSAQFAHTTKIVWFDHPVL